MEQIEFVGRRVGYGVANGSFADETRTSPGENRFALSRPPFAERRGRESRSGSQIWNIRDGLEPCIIRTCVVKIRCC